MNSKGYKKLENEWEEGVLTSAIIIHDCDLTLNAMYTVYQSGGVIIPELSNINGNCYSKDCTGKRGGARVKFDPGKNRWLYRRVLSANKDIITGILTRTIYENDNSDVSCYSKLSKCSANDLSGCDNSFTSYNYGASHDKP